MTADPNFFLFALHGLLDLKKPIELRICTDRPRAHREYETPCMAAAWYEVRVRKGRIMRHVININLRVCVESRFALNDVIAHEVVHAAQHEHGIFNQNFHHDEKFQKLCRYVRKEMKKAGYPLGKIFDKNSDVD